MTTTASTTDERRKIEINVARAEGCSLEVRWGHVRGDYYVLTQQGKTISEWGGERDAWRVFVINNTEQEAWGFLAPRYLTDGNVSQDLQERHHIDVRFDSGNPIATCKGYYAMGSSVREAICLAFLAGVQAGKG